MTLGLLLLIAAPSPLVPAIAAAPDGPWRLEGDGAVIAGEDPVIEVRGTGDDSSAWLADVELEAGALYRLTFDMRGSGVPNSTSEISVPIIEPPQPSPRHVRAA